jgi:hypothetical protein
MLFLGPQTETYDIRTCNYHRRSYKTSLLFGFLFTFLYSMVPEKGAYVTDNRQLKEIEFPADA